MIQGKPNCKITRWLLILGALNWGLIGLGYFFGGYWNIIYIIFGQWPIAENIAYLLIGASVIKILLSSKKNCHCE